MDIRMIKIDSYWYEDGPMAIACVLAALICKKFILNHLDSTQIGVNYKLQNHWWDIGGVLSGVVSIQPQRRISNKIIKIINIHIKQEWT